MDMNQGQAFRGTHLLNLTPTEYRLLVYLLQNQGIALTRTQIKDAVWGYAPDLEEERTVYEQAEADLALAKANGRERSRLPARG